MRKMLKKTWAARWTVLLMLTPSALWSQGTSPWVDAVNELQTQFTGPIARGLSPIAIVIGGLMFAFGEGGEQADARGDHLRSRDGDGRGELPRLALLMRDRRR